MRICLSLLFAALLLTPAPSRAQAGRPAATAKVDDTTNVINDCQKKTEKFKRRVRMKGRGTTPNLQTAADKLEESMSKVGDSWNRDKNLQASRTYVEQAIVAGKAVNVLMVGFQGEAVLVNQWSDIKVALNTLARTFNVPSITW